MGPRAPNVDTKKSQHTCQKSVADFLKTSIFYETPDLRVFGYGSKTQIPNCFACRSIHLETVFLLWRLTLVTEGGGPGM